MCGSGNPDPNIPSWGWFVGLTYMVERYWGGSAPDSAKCACGLKGECRSSGSGASSNPCNCDAGLASIDVFDDGYITDMDRLPVMELHFGDTGLIGDEKWGKHVLGPLRCEGDSTNAYLCFCWQLAIYVVVMWFVDWLSK